MSSRLGKRRLIVIVNPAGIRPANQPNSYEDTVYYVFPATAFKRFPLGSVWHVWLRGDSRLQTRGVYLYPDLQLLRSGKGTVWLEMAALLLC